MLALRVQGFLERQQAAAGPHPPAHKLTEVARLLYGRNQSDARHWRLLLEHLLCVAHLFLVAISVEANEKGLNTGAMWLLVISFACGILFCDDNRLSAR